MRKKLAGYLRDLAYMLDREDFIRARWHKLSIEGMNRYVAKTERYIYDLERALGKRAEAIRKLHPGRRAAKPQNPGVWN